MTDKSNFFDENAFKIKNRLLDKMRGRGFIGQFQVDLEELKLKNDRTRP